MFNYLGYRTIILDDYEGMDSYEKNAKKNLVRKAKRLQQSLK
jgi:hypothetical protein